MPCNEDDMCAYKTISIFDKSFWDLWIQKVLRNLSSMKCQLIWGIFWFIYYGMYHCKDRMGDFVISPTIGLSFLSGGFIAILGAKLVVKTSLFESSTDPLDSDR